MNYSFTLAFISMLLIGLTIAIAMYRGYHQETIW